jgi:hypothetical protein
VLPVGSTGNPFNSLTNDNHLLFPPNPGPYDLNGLALSVDGLASLVACLAAVCGVGYPDPNNTSPEVIDHFIHPATFTVTQTPLPAALPLFATGLGAMGLFGWRKKRKAAAALAAA